MTDDRRARRRAVIVLWSAAVLAAVSLVLTIVTYGDTGTTSRVVSGVQVALTLLTLAILVYGLVLSTRVGRQEAVRDAGLIPSAR